MTSSYKRRYSGFNNYYSRELTKVSCIWSQNAQAYQIVFHKNGKWYPTKDRFTKIQEVFVRFFSNLPYGDSRKEVSLSTDPRTNEEVQSWTYYLAEKHLENFKILVEMMPEDFELDFMEKPDETNSFSSKVVPVEQLLDKFAELVGVSIVEMKNADYKTAKKYYRQTIVDFHPDKNNNDGLLASLLNATWTALEIQHFKTRTIPEQEKEPITI